MSFFMHRHTNIYMTYSISLLKTKVLLTILFGHLFFSIVNHRSDNMWLYFLLLHGCIHLALPLLMSSWYQKSWTCLQSWPRSFFFLGCCWIRSRCCLLADSVIAPHPGTLRVLELTVVRDWKSNPIHCFTKGSQPVRGSFPRSPASCPSRGMQSSQHRAPDFHLPTPPWSDYRCDPHSPDHG